MGSDTRLSKGLSLHFSAMSDNQNITFQGPLNFSSVGGVGITAAFVHANNGIQVHHHQNTGRSPSPSRNYDDRSPRHLEPDQKETLRKSKSGVPITNELALFVANHVGKDWRQLGITLELENHELDNVFKDNEREGNVEVAYEMLRKWREKNFRYATRDLLEDALLRINRSDIVEQIPTNDRSDDGSLGLGESGEEGK